MLSDRRKYLDRPSLWCICLYLISVIVNCGYSIYDVVTKDNEHVRGMKIIYKTAEFLALGVFHYFAFDLSLVKLRLESFTMSIFAQKHRKRRFILFYLIFPAILINWLIEITLNIFFEDILVIDSVPLFSLDIFSHILTLLLNILLSSLLWHYSVYFFKKKKLMMMRKNQQFSLKQKFLVIWAIIILAANSIDMIADGLIQTVHLIIHNNSMDNFLKYWTLYKHIWYDIFILNNGLVLLGLYRYFAKIKENSLGRKPH